MVNASVTHYQYTAAENQIWQYLYHNQISNLQHKAYDRYLECLNELSLPENHVPQISDVSNTLKKKTGWELVCVTDLINYEQFFDLLAQKKFPSTQYIRTLHEIELSKDPDIFHELFGHAPLLMDHSHSLFLQEFAKLSLRLGDAYYAIMSRVFWFTYEVGLLHTADGLRIYGGSILSSRKESSYVFNEALVLKKKFDLIDIIRTPYRADLLQEVYYIANSFSGIYEQLLDAPTIRSAVKKASQLGEYLPTFKVEGATNKYTNIHILEKHSTQRSLELMS